MAAFSNYQNTAGSSDDDGSDLEVPEIDFLDEDDEDDDEEGGEGEDDDEDEIDISQYIVGKSEAPKMPPRLQTAPRPPPQALFGSLSGIALQRNPQQPFPPLQQQFAPPQQPFPPLQQQFTPQQPFPPLQQPFPPPQQQFAPQQSLPFAPQQLVFPSAPQQPFPSAPQQLVFPSAPQQLVFPSAPQQSLPFAPQQPFPSAPQQPFPSAPQQPSAVPSASILLPMGQPTSTVLGQQSFPQMMLAVSQPLVPSLEPLGKTFAGGDIEKMLEKMPGLNISAIMGTVSPDINDLLQKESDESPEDFDSRKQLTLRLASLTEISLNNTTAVQVGFLVMKKTKLGVLYDRDVEQAISYLLARIQ